VPDGTRGSGVEAPRPALSGWQVEALDQDQESPASGDVAGDGINLLEAASHRTLAGMADDDKEPTLPIPSPQRPQSAWYLDQSSQPGRVEVTRNNALLDAQPAFVASPQPRARNEDIEAIRNNMLAVAALVDDTLARLRALEALPAGQPPGMGHNQGPSFAPLSPEELDEVEHLTALLKNQGPAPPPPADCAALIEQTERTTTRLSDKIRNALLEVAKGGLRELGKEASIPLWTALAYWLGELGQQQHVKVWLSSLPLN
jgi:hypothetical protein